MVLRMKTEKNSSQGGFCTRFKTKTKKLLKIIGPGFITGSADDDPSGIGTYSVAGAQYGPLFLWLIPFQLPLMYAMQNMSARIGLVTGKGLAANMIVHFPKTVVYAAIFLLVVSNIINIGADISIMAASLNLILNCHVHYCSIISTLVIVLVTIFVPYHTYAKVLLFLCSFLLAYVITAFITVTDWPHVFFYTFVPHMQWNKDFFIMVAGFIGTTISPYLFFWQASQEVEENLDNKSAQQIEDRLSQMPEDTFFGMLFSQFISLCIVLTCYFTLHKSGITNIQSAYDAALALKPLAGEYASLIFSAGMIGSGLLGIPVLAGSSAYALAELYDKPKSLAHTFSQARFFYGVIIASTVCGLLINFININPIKALVYAAVINCVAAVPFIVFIMILCNKQELMGKYKNGYFLNSAGGITFALMFLATILLVVF